MDYPNQMPYQGPQLVPGSLPFQPQQQDQQFQQQQQQPPGYQHGYQQQQQQQGFYDQGDGFVGTGFNGITNVQQNQFYPHNFQPHQQQQQQLQQQMGGGGYPVMQTSSMQTSFPQLQNDFLDDLDSLFGTAGEQKPHCLPFAGEEEDELNSIVDQVLQDIGLTNSTDTELRDIGDCFNELNEVLETKFESVTELCSNCGTLVTTQINMCLPTKDEQVLFNCTSCQATITYKIESKPPVVDEPSTTPPPPPDKPAPAPGQQQQQQSKQQSLADGLSSPPGASTSTLRNYRKSKSPGPVKSSPAAVAVKRSSGKPRNMAEMSQRKGPPGLPLAFEESRPLASGSSNKKVCAVAPSTHVEDSGCGVQAMKVEAHQMPGHDQKSPTKAPNTVVGVVKPRVVVKIKLSETSVLKLDNMSEDEGPSKKKRKKVCYCLEGDLKKCKVCRKKEKRKLSASPAPPPLVVKDLKIKPLPAPSSPSLPSIAQPPPPPKADMEKPIPSKSRSAQALSKTTSSKVPQHHPVNTKAPVAGPSVSKSAPSKESFPKLLVSKSSKEASSARPAAKEPMPPRVITPKDAFELLESKDKAMKLMKPATTSVIIPKDSPALKSPPKESVKSSSLKPVKLKATTTTTSSSKKSVSTSGADNHNDLVSPLRFYRRRKEDQDDDEVEIVGEKKATNGLPFEVEDEVLKTTHSGGGGGAQAVEKAKKAKSKNLKSCTVNLIRIDKRKAAAVKAAKEISKTKARDKDDEDLKVVYQKEATTKKPVSIALSTPPVITLSEAETRWILEKNKKENLKKAAMKDELISKSSKATIKASSSSSSSSRSSQQLHSKPVKRLSSSPRPSSSSSGKPRPLSKKPVESSSRSPVPIRGHKEAKKPFVPSLKYPSYPGSSSKGHKGTTTTNKVVSVKHTIAAAISNAIPRDHHSSSKVIKPVKQLQFARIPKLTGGAASNNKGLLKSGSGHSETVQPPSSNFVKNPFFDQRKHFGQQPAVKSSCTTLVSSSSSSSSVTITKSSSDPKMKMLQIQGNKKI